MSITQYWRRSNLAPISGILPIVFSPGDTCLSFRCRFFTNTESAYSLETRTGFPFNEFTDQQQLIGKPGAQRFPAYFSLNVQLEKRFHFLGYYLAVRGGFDNITGRCDPYVVNSVIDPTHPQPTFTACQGRAFTSRIRLLGRK